MFRWCVYSALKLFLLPYLIACLLSANREVIFADVVMMMDKAKKKMSIYSGLAYFLYTNSYYRTIFKMRVGRLRYIANYLPLEKTFVVEKFCSIGGGIYCAHPFSTIINARSVGTNFSFRNNTTIGNKRDGDKLTPIIGDNVTLGANVCVIGNITIGDNVIVGAGSVVVKSIPDNCMVAGNPAQIIKNL